MCNILFKYDNKLTLQSSAFVGSEYLNQELHPEQNLKHICNSYYLRYV